MLARFNLFDARTHARDVAAHEEGPPPLALALAIYRDFVAAVKKEGAVPVLLLLPSREQVAERRMLSAEKPWRSSILLRDALLALCTANALTCIDALDDLARPEVAFDSLFIPGDTHFSAAGHRMIADLLAETLEDILDSLTPAPH